MQSIFVCQPSLGNKMNRDNALNLLKKYVKSPNMLKHSLASEAVLGALAERLSEEKPKWQLAGLLHDIDIEVTNADLEKHGVEAEKILEKENIDQDVIEAIKLHNQKATGIKRDKKFHHALAAGETITGLITATALVYPDKKLKSVKVKSIVKRMKEKAFAASVDRDIIRECEKIDIPLREFAEISLMAMQEISDELGL